MGILPDLNKNKPNLNDERFGLIGAKDARLGSAVNPNVQNIGSNTRYGYMGNDGRILQYPLDLGTDSTHYMVFHIYQTEGGDIEDAVQKVDALDLAKDNHEQLLETEKAIRSAASPFAEMGMLSNNENDILFASILGDTANRTGEKAAAQAVKVENLAKEVSKLSSSSTANAKKQNMAKNINKSGRVNETNNISKDSIILYMPQKLNSLNMIDYELEGFETVTAMKEVLGKAGEGDWVGAIAAASGFIVGKALNELGSAAASLGIGNPMSVVKVLGKVAINPQKEMIFNSPGPRKYEFAFEFAPRSEEESMQVRNIVQMFKFHAFPSVTNFSNDFFGAEHSDAAGFAERLGSERGSTWYRMPSEFQFEYMHIDKTNGGEIVSENHYLNKSERCVLTEVNVDYSGAGTFQSFESGAPTHVTLTLTFSEARLLTREHIALGY